MYLFTSGPKTRPGSGKVRQAPYSATTCASSRLHCLTPLLRPTQFPMQASSQFTKSNRVHNSQFYQGANISASHSRKDVSYNGPEPLRHTQHQQTSDHNTMTRTTLIPPRLVNTSDHRPGFSSAAQPPRPVISIPITKNIQSETNQWQPSNLSAPVNSSNENIFSPANASDSFPSSPITSCDVI